MKNKKMMLTLGILALVLVLGVGYAIVSSVSLAIDGTASVAGSDLKVSFNGTVTPDDSGKVTATATENSLNGTIMVKDLSLNDIVYAEYTVQNKETDIEATIKKETITNDKPEFFEVTTDVDSTSKSIAAGDTTTVRVTVKLIKTPVDANNSTANINIKLKADPVQQ